jgi:lactate permease
MMTITFYETGMRTWWQHFSSKPVLRWMQGYDPTHHWWLSTGWAALPLLGIVDHDGGIQVEGASIGAALLERCARDCNRRIPYTCFACRTCGSLRCGLFPIFWIIFPVIFLYQLTVKANRFDLLQGRLIDVTEDSRLQLLLGAFCLGAFFEGAARFGTPVAVCSTILLGLGFTPVESAGLSLLAILRR